MRRMGALRCERILGNYLGQYFRPGRHMKTNIASHTTVNLNLLDSTDKPVGLEELCLLHL